MALKLLLPIIKPGLIFMNTKIFILLNLLFIIFLLKYCRIPFEAEQSSPLAGSWQWLYSSGGFAGNTIIPETSGSERIIKFGPGKLYMEITDSKLIRFSEYKIQNGRFTLDDSEIKYRYSIISRDTLVISEDCIDCYTHKYVRR